MKEKLKRYILISTFFLILQRRTGKRVANLSAYGGESRSVYRIKPIAETSCKIKAKIILILRWNKITPAFGGSNSLELRSTGTSRFYS